jgi:hypothetical protein
MRVLPIAVPAVLPSIVVRYGIIIPSVVLAVTAIQRTIVVVAHLLLSYSVGSPPFLVLEVPTMLYGR